MKTVLKQRLLIRIKITLFQFVLALVFQVTIANNIRGQKNWTKVTITVTDLNLDTALTKLEKKQM
jgi:iron complex outermembrane receptor protein